jgi:hypothetical protein
VIAIDTKDLPVRTHQGDRVRSIEPGSGSEDLLEILWAELPRRARGELGLVSTHRRPRPQAGALPQPVGSTQRQRGLQGIVSRQGELSKGNETWTLCRIAALSFGSVMCPSSKA